MNGRKFFGTLAGAVVLPRIVGETMPTILAGQPRHTLTLHYENKFAALSSALAAGRGVPFEEYSELLGIEGRS